MYRCGCCKQDFPKNYIVRNTEYVLHDEVDDMMYEKVVVEKCPYCGSIDIMEVCYYGE